MSKPFKTSDDIYNFIMGVWNETNCPSLGINLKVMSTAKSKQILKLSRIDAKAEYIIREDSVITLVVYEEAFDRLDDFNKTLLLKGIFSLVSYDFDHDAVIIDNKAYADLFNMRHSKDANGNEYLDLYDNALETASIIIEEINEEEKQRKEEEKERKREARELKRAMKKKQ
jgi:hypothetical protein